MNVGREGIFFLQADSANAFYRQVEYGLPVGKLEPHFEDARKVVAALAKTYADPTAALRADKAPDRRFAAVALLARYRAVRPLFGTTTQVDEPIPADESKLILNVLAEMKWNDPPLDPAGVISLPSAFQMLGLSEKDGWRPPQPKANEDPNVATGKAVAEWLKNHSATYRIQRRVVQVTDAKPGR